MERTEKGRFQTIYLKSKGEVRDRFQVELGKEERDLLTQMQKTLLQAKDATALKQWAFFGWLSFSNIEEAHTYFREKLLINNRNNQRLGINVETELENKFQQRILKLGGKMQE